MKIFYFYLLVSICLAGFVQSNAEAQVTTDITRAFQQQCSDVIQAYNTNGYSNIKFSAKNYLNKVQEFSVATTATSSCVFDGSRLIVRIETSRGKRFDFEFVLNAQNNFEFISSLNECAKGIAEYSQQLKDSHIFVSQDKINNFFNNEYCPNLTVAMKTAFSSAIQSIVGNPN